MDRIGRNISLLAAIWAGFLLGCNDGNAQSYLARGDSLHRSYRFEDALSQYMAALRRAEGPEAQQQVYGRIDQAQTALNMADFCYSPEVVARKTVTRREFFLYFPLQNLGWHEAPNPLDTLPGPFPLYLPGGSKRVVFSTPDPTGARNLCFSEEQNGEWSAPALLDERLVSSGNEILPVLSSDGNTLYFASDGFYGMGGYDLYVSRKESDRRWSTPENLGIPFSSPGDDFLLMDTEDRKFTLFASNRDCAKDSVRIYVLEYDPLPVRTPIHDPAALQVLSHLNPPAAAAQISSSVAVTGLTSNNDNTRLYRSKSDEARALRDSIYRYEKDLDALRSVFPSTDGASRSALSRIIAEKEDALIPIRRDLDAVNAEIRRIEQSFLRGGVVQTIPDRPAEGASKDYTFTKKLPGQSLNIRVHRRPPVLDEVFAIMPIGRFADAEGFPKGLVFQIQLFTSLRHATLDEIHGLTPVYERLSSSLRYHCCAGIFRSYQSALSRLNTVRALGFREATIVAFRDGRTEDIMIARQLAP